MARSADRSDRAAIDQQIALVVARESAMHQRSLRTHLRGARGIRDQLERLSPSSQRTYLGTIGAWSYTETIDAETRFARPVATHSSTGAGDANSRYPNRKRYEIYPRSLAQVPGFEPHHWEHLRRRGLFVYQYSPNGSDRGVLAVRRPRERDPLVAFDDVSQFQISRDHKHVYFVQFDVADRTNTVRRLDLNDIHATPVIVDTARSRQLSLAITMFESLELLVISHTSQICASYSVVDTTMPSASAERIRLPAKTLNANFAEDATRHQLIALVTKADGSNHVLRATRTPTGLDPWQHFATLAYPATSIQPTRRSYFVVERRDGVAAARQIDATTGAQIPIITVAVGQLALAAPEYAAPSINDDPTLIELQTSTATQPMTYHGLTNGALISTHTQVRDHRWRNYREWTLSAPTPDNVSVPIHLARHRDADPKLARPTLLVCYGGFCAANDPYFEDSHKILLDDGWNIGFVATRGGGDFGLKWQQSGSGVNATVGSADLITATQYLIKQRIADRNRVVAVGASYGGFVIGHAINLHPRLFRSVVVEAPWVDPLGDWQHDRNDSVHTLITAFGDVARSPHALRQLSLINPATNVAPGHFPAVYATIGRNDTRVSPIGVATWTEELRTKTTSKAPVILEVLDGGHCAARQPNGLLRPQIGARAVAFIEHTTAPLATQARQTRPSTTSVGHELGIVLN